MFAAYTSSTPIESYLYPIYSPWLSWTDRTCAVILCQEVAMYTNQLNI
jgi:hypothetical protein